MKETDRHCIRWNYNHKSITLGKRTLSSFSERPNNLNVWIWQVGMSKYAILLIKRQ